jgi:hypothetical protein
VITRINSTNPSSTTLASFKVIVTLETSLLNIVITGIIILVIFGGRAYLMIIVKKVCLCHLPVSNSSLAYSKLSSYGSRQEEQI